MEAVGAERIERLEIEVLQNVEHHQRGEALPVRRQLDEVEATIIARDRRDGVAVVARKILCGQKRAARLDGRCHVVGYLAFVESARALGGNGLERRGQCGKTNN